MSSIQERLQLKRVPLDTWNVREQLCLASAVVRSGDQNWMSVSRALKTVGEPNRPADWYSQKSCAAQYGALLEHVETPKRKKRSSEGAVETPQESILKRLTQERTAEIQKNIQEMNRQYEVLKNEITEARNSATADERLREMWAEIEAAKRTRERETARRAAWLREREERRARAERTWRPPAHQQAAGVVCGSPAPPSSPLLTSLLKSSPVVTTPQHITHPANVVDTVSPSAGAPTLSMLLEKGDNKPLSPPLAPHPSAAPPHPPPSPPHESKHAAIEHIKSQLQQIEHQLKARPPPVSLPAPVVPVPIPAPVVSVPDIDDIEIKAEDVYAFRDIDLPIPPVTALHKPSRVVEKASFKKDDPELPPPIVTHEVADQLIDDIKVEPMVVDAVPEEAAVDVETSEPPSVPPSEASPEVEVPPEEGVKFPEVKFPAPEIKVLWDDTQVKEEVKETEIVVEPEKEQDVQINVEDVPTIEPTSNDQEPIAEESQEALETVAAETKCEHEFFLLPPVLPKDIPLPESAAATETVIPLEQIADIPLPPQPEETIKEEPQQEEERVEVHQSETEVQEEERTEERTEEIKQDEDAEDSIPLKEMIREEAYRKPEVEAIPEPEPEVKEEPPPELEETHTETDDDTPMELSREEEKDGKKRRDYSRKKKPDSRTCSGSESAAEASAPESELASSADRQHRLWKKSVMLVYSRLCAHKYASLFLRPISDEEAPGYSLVIKRPMDLTTIRRNIEAGVTRTTSEFQRDVLLMLSNALMYNHSEHSVYRMTKEMFEEAQNQLGMLVAAQAHAGLVPADPAPAPTPLPARRKRRHRHDSPLPLPLPLPPAKRQL